MEKQPGDGTETLPRILSSIKQGAVSPCYLLYGEEEYLIQDALNKMVELLVPPEDRELNLFYIEGGQENIAALCQALLTVPLLPGRKVICVKNTMLFQSRKVLPSLIQRIREQSEKSPGQAASDFLQFLKLAGWKLADLTDEGWKRITGEEWQKVVEGDSGDDREKWLPKMIDFCAEQGLETAAAADDPDRLSKVLAGRLPAGNHLISTAQAVDKRKQIFKHIAGLGKVLYFPPVKGDTKQRFLLLETAEEFLARRGKRLTPAAWEAIGSKTGFDLRDSMVALEKLAAYAGAVTLIDAVDVEEVIGKTKEATIFELTDALGEKKLSQALLILKDLLEQGVHHLVILKMLTREIRLLLYAQLLLMSGKLAAYKANMDYSRFQSAVYPVIKSWGGKEKEGPASLTGQHPFVIYRMLKNAGRFPFDILVRHLEYLAETDLALRSTGKDPQLMLERFLTEVCQSPAGHQRARLTH